MLWYSSWFGQHGLVRVITLISIRIIVTATTQISKFMVISWGPPGSCRPQMGPMWAPWTLLWRKMSLCNRRCQQLPKCNRYEAFSLHCLHRNKPTWAYYATASHEHHGVANNRHLDCFLAACSGAYLRKDKNSTLLALCRGMNLLTNATHCLYIWQSEIYSTMCYANATTLYPLRPVSIYINVPTSFASIGFPIINKQERQGASKWSSPERQSICTSGEIRVCQCH